MLLGPRFWSYLKLYVNDATIPPEYERHKQFDGEVDDLDPTEDGEAGEESHGAADEAKLGLQGDLHIPLNLVIGGRVEENLNQLQRGEFKFISWTKYVIYFATCQIYVLT